jgi:hypothetical protein
VEQSALKCIIGWTQVFTSLLGGIMALRFGRMRTIIATQLISAAAGLPLGLTTDFSVIFCAQIIGGCGSVASETEALILLANPAWSGSAVVRPIPRLAAGLGSAPMGALSADVLPSPATYGRDSNLMSIPGDVVSALTPVACGMLQGSSLPSDEM